MTLITAPITLMAGLLMRIPMAVIIHKRLWQWFVIAAMTLFALAATFVWYADSKGYDPVTALKRAEARGQDWVDSRFADPVPWETATPESQGLDGPKLDALREGLAARNTDALLVVKGNKIVYEWYSESAGGATRRYSTASLAKPLVGSMALWVALSDGLIGLDDRASQYVPYWGDDPLKSQITVRHLATHSSGIRHFREIGGPTSGLAAWEEEYWRRTQERVNIAITDAPVVFQPGTQYAYSDPGMSALGYVITASLQGAPQTDIYDVLKERIMGPIGVPESNWRFSYNEVYELDGMDVYQIAGGASYTARAVARVGQLVLQKGYWEGEQILDPIWAEKMLSHIDEPLLEVPSGYPQPGIGGWHTNLDKTWPSLPGDAIVGIGAGHQVLAVIPSMDLVLVRMGKWLDGTPGPGSQFYDDLEPFLFKPFRDVTIESSVLETP